MAKALLRLSILCGAAGLVVGALALLLGGDRGIESLPVLISPLVLLIVAGLAAAGLRKDASSK